MKDLGINLLKTTGLSMPIAAVFNVGYYIMFKKNNTYDNMHVMISIVKGTLYIDAILALMAIPSLFLSYKIYWDNKITRALLYFSGPVLFLLTAIFTNASPSNIIIYLITAVVFLLVYAFFYYRLLQYPHVRH